MNRAARLSILAAYAAAAAWALAPAPPKPLAATIAPPPPALEDDDSPAGDIITPVPGPRPTHRANIEAAMMTNCR
jgi:hypothetical protein